MNFNYQDEYVSQSPLDFNYQFGLNNNTPDKFNCNDIKVKSTINTSLVSNLISIPNTLISAAKLLDDEEYEIEEIPLNIISFNSPIKLGTMQKINIQDNTMKYLSNIATSTLTTTSGIVSSLPSNVNNWDTGKYKRGLDVGDTYVVKNSNITKVDNGNTAKVTSGQITSLIFSGIQLGITIGNSIINGISRENQLDSYKGMIDKQIELLNENIDANREFIQQAKEAIAQRQNRFEKSSKIQKARLL